MSQLTDQQINDIQEITFRAIAVYKGHAQVLESAIGALNLGYHVGWRVLYVLHDKKTIRKYEDILGIKFREYFEETGPGSERSLGYKAILAIKKFWNVVNGDIKVANKTELTE